MQGGFPQPPENPCQVRSLLETAESCRGSEAELQDGRSLEEGKSQVFLEGAIEPDRGEDCVGTLSRERQFLKNGALQIKNFVHGTNVRGFF